MTKAKRVEYTDVNRELQKVISDGKVVLGARETKKALRREDAKLVIHASNCPQSLRYEFKELCEEAGVPLYEYHANSRELGLACGKPYSVASLCVVDTEGTDILKVLASSSASSSSKVSGSGSDER